MRRIARAAAISGTALLVVLALAGCPASSAGLPPSSAKAITAFGFVSPAVTGTVTESNHTVAVTVPAGTAVTALVATFSTTGVSVKVGSTDQVSGTTPNDFTNPVTYTVVGADNSTQNYVVTVTVASPYNISSIVTSSGTLSFNGSAWAFDAGSVPQYATETVTFTVTNSGGSDFVATGSQSFTPATDFSDSINGTFTVSANSSNSFTGSFTPTGKPSSVERGTLTLTPPSGSPITIGLQGTSIASFGVYVGGNGSTGGAQIANGETYPFYGSVPTAGVTFSIANVSSSADINLTGSSPVTSSNSDFSVIQPSSTKIAAGGQNYVTFTVKENVSLPGDTSTITVQGTDTTTNAPFTFSFYVQYKGAG